MADLVDCEANVLVDGGDGFEGGEVSGRGVEGLHAAFEGGGEGHTDVVDGGLGGRGIVGGGDVGTVDANGVGEANWWERG